MNRRGIAMVHGAARALALFIGAFGLLNALSQFVTGFDGNRWWIDFSPLPSSASHSILVAGSILLVAHALAPATGDRLRLTQGAVAALLLGGVANTVSFYVVIARGTPAFPLPISMLVVVALATVLAESFSPGGARPRDVIVVLAACLVGFPLAQIFLFGKTDYRRRADAIVVFGARAYADGRPSDALADRVRTACHLYRDGLAPSLVFTGGPGDAGVHETEAMRRMALGLGVPESAILLDPEGVTTQASVRSTCAMFDRIGARRIIAVSHFYHLARVKMTYQAAGREVLTVPARESYTLSRMPYFVAREVAVLWLYYLRSLGTISKN